MKFKVFALDFDSSNADDVAFVNKTIKDLFSSSETDDCTVTEATASVAVEKPADAPKTTRAPRKQKTQPVVENPQPEETNDLPFSEETEEPTAKEMQDLVIGLIKAGTLTREDVQNIFQEFGGTSLSKIPATKFVLLKQRLTTYHG